MGFVNQAAALALAVAALHAVAAQKPAPETRAPAPSGAASKTPANVPKAPFTFSVEPVPAWVVPARESRDARVDRAPLHYKVIDDQTLDDGKAVVRFSRVLRVVNDTSGLGQAAQLELVFDPGYQALVFHHVDIVRDGKRTSRLDRRKVQLLQRETQLERRIYDGSVTASMVLDDVRVGDQIDIAYSVRGDNPVFGGRFVAMEWMAPWRGPSALYQYRLVTPESRHVALRAGSPDMQVETKLLRGMRETVIRREAVPILHIDTGAPASAGLRHQVQLSEFADWADVARWGTALFDAAGATAGALLDQKAAELRAGSADPEQQLLATLRFVQAEVRYFGTENGLNSHKPAAPQKVLEQRFGDCKDKVALFVALLRRLNIAATPVLVSTRHRGQVDALLPSPLAFDHVIARVELNAKTYWLDVTRSHQSGPLAARQAIGLNRGLLLAPQTTALAELPTPYDTERLAVADVFRIAKFADGAHLESRVTYRGDLAEGMREAIATRSLADIEPQLTQGYARIYPKLKRTEPLRVEASETDDAVTLVQNFDIPEFWRFPDERALVADIVQWGVIDAIRPPNEPSRRDPFMLALPGIHRHVSAIEYLEDVNRAPLSQRFDDGDSRVSLRTRAEFSARRAEVSSEARIGVDEIGAADWAAYTAQIAKMGPRVAIALSAPAIGIDRFETLRKELQGIDESMKAGRVRPRSKVQYEALAKSSVLSAQLDEGRLAPALRAQALTARGIQYDHLGRFAAAAQDFAQALELAPDVAETVNGSAVNAVQSADYPRAITLAGRALAKNPNDTEALNTRALARVFMKDYAAARLDFQDLLKDRAQVRRGYPIVWLSILDRQAGLDPGQTLARFTDEQLSTDWPRPIVDWARGRSNIDTLVNSAKSDRGAAERLCEAYYYIAERYLAEGDTRRAIEYFHKTVDQGITEFVEDAAARNRIAELKR